MTESVLFLEKVFLKCLKPDHGFGGVELFNIEFIKDLIKLGCRIEVPVHPSWSNPLDQLVDSPKLRIISLSSHCTQLSALGRCMLGGPWHALFAANVGDTLIAPLIALKIRRRFQFAAILAHRMPTQAFLSLVQPLNIPVVCVNHLIEARFAADSWRASTYYGVTRADNFVPVDRRPGRHAKVRFAVLGDLDRTWKGADTAAAAFELLPQKVQDRAELHLAYFGTKPPDYTNRPFVVLHNRLAPQEVPEFLQSMDVLIVPSRDEEIMRETFSQVMVLGMCTALPIITSDRPVLLEKIDTGGGLSFADTAELAECIKRLTNDYELRSTLGVQARQIALERYIWDSEFFAKKYLGLEQL